MLQEMLEQEKKHLSKMCELIPQNRVRPTVLSPIWNVAGFLLGKKACHLHKWKNLATALQKITLKETRVVKWSLLRITTIVKNRKYL